MPVRAAAQRDRASGSVACIEREMKRASESARGSASESASASESGALKASEHETHETHATHAMHATLVKQAAGREPMTRADDEGR